MANTTFASPPADQTYVVPSPKEETAPPSPSQVDMQQFGLDPDQPQHSLPKAPAYHLEPRPSFTVGFSRGYETREKNHHGWIGLHVAPWMTATTRFQIGLDIHNDVGWLQLAAHSLPTRNLYRLYWGGGLSLIWVAQREFRPLVDKDMYHLFLAGGWEFQILERQNIRVEMSFHQGLETGYAKGFVGYTRQF